MSRTRAGRLYESGNSPAVNITARAREYDAPCDKSGSLKRARTPLVSDVVNLTTNAAATHR